MYVGEIDHTNISVEFSDFSTEMLCEAAEGYWSNGCFSPPPPLSSLLSLLKKTASAQVSLGVLLGKSAGDTSGARLLG